MLLYLCFVLVTLLVISYTIGGILLPRGFISRHVKGHHNDVLVPIFLTGGAIYAVFLAFMVVSVWEAHNSTKANVAAEASGLATMYRVTAGMEPVSGTALRQLIRAYTTEIIVNEWPLEARRGGTTDNARSLAVNLFEVFGHLNQSARQNDNLLDQTELQLLIGTIAARNTRVLDADEDVSPVIWTAAIASGLIVIAMTFVLYMETAWLQLVMASFLATMICMLLCITYMLSQPFSGPLAISADPFRHSLAVFDHLDKILPASSQLPP